MHNYIAFGLTLETDVDFTGVLQPSTASADVRIRQGTIHQNAHRPTRIQRRGIRAKLGIQSDGLTLAWEGVGWFRVSNGREIIYQCTDADAGTLRLFLLSEVFGLLLYQRGLFLLHGSAVQIRPDKAVVFLGVPGAGKSTTAAAFGKAGHIVLTDDLVAIQLINKKPFVVPAFSQYKVWQNSVDGLALDTAALTPSYEGATKYLVTQSMDAFPQQPVPLHQINLLCSPRSRKENKSIKLLHAPVELLRHFPLPVQLLTGHYLKTHFEEALSIAQAASIRQLKRPSGFDALDLFVREFAVGSDEPLT